MTTERIKEIQSQTAYPDSISVQQALLQVWNECVEYFDIEISDEEIRNVVNKSNIKEDMYRTYFIMGSHWYREQLKTKK